MKTLGNKMHFRLVKLALSLFVFKEYPCLLSADVGNGWEFALFQVVEIQRLAFYDEAALKGIAFM